MSTIVTFAGNLVDDPELLYTRENKPFVTCRVGVDHRYPNAEGDWVSGETTFHDVKIYGSAARNLHASVGRGSRVIVIGLMRTEAWTEKESGAKRAKNIVEVSNNFGEVGPSLRWDGAPVRKTPRPKPVQSGPTESAAAAS